MEEFFSTILMNQKKQCLISIFKNGTIIKIPMTNYHVTVDWASRLISIEDVLIGISAIIKCEDWKQLNTEILFDKSVLYDFTTKAGRYQIYIYG